MPAMSATFWCGKPRNSDHFWVKPPSLKFVLCKVQRVVRQLPKMSGQPGYLRPLPSNLLLSQNCDDVRRDETVVDQRLAVPAVHVHVYHVCIGVRVACLPHRRGEKAVVFAGRRKRTEQGSGRTARCGRHFEVPKSCLVARQVRGPRLAWNRGFFSRAQSGRGTKKFEKKMRKGLLTLKRTRLSSVVLSDFLHFSPQYLHGSTVLSR